MRTAFIIVKHQGLEGRFMVGQWTEEEAARLYPDGSNGIGFLDVCGWGSKEHWANACLHYALVMEINRSPVEGSIFAIGGSPAYDLKKRKMPQRGLSAMWEDFLAWLYANLYSAGRGPGQTALEDLPALVDLDAAPPNTAARKEARIG